jgi:membrane fusion protein (multidrug efflux system)
MFARRYLSEGAPVDRKKRKAKFELILADGSLYEHKGKADFFDREVDPTTGAMLVQASFPNPDEIIRPGQFARVKAQVEVVKEGILIPQRCMSELQGTYSVFVVTGDNKIERRAVKAGPKVGAFWLITEGLKPGEQIVYEGMQKIKDGVIVNPVIKEIALPSKEDT